MITAVIPARAGSKGIPRKNMIEVCGKPLIGWTIEQALAARTVDEVLVTSDSREIGEYARSLGADWFSRSDMTATDTAPSEAALIEVMDCLKYEVDLFVFLQATSPIRQPNDIDGAVQRLRQVEADSLFSARHIEGYTWTAGSVVTPNYQERQPRQFQCLRRLEENGSIYVYRPDVLRKYKNRLGGKIDFWEMHPLDSFQVDTPSDVPIIEQLIAIRLGQECAA